MPTGDGRNGPSIWGCDVGCIRFLGGEARGWSILSALHPQVCLHCHLPPVHCGCAPPLSAFCLLKSGKGIISLITMLFAIAMLQMQRCQTYGFITRTTQRKLVVLPASPPPPSLHHELVLNYDITSKYHSYWFSPLPHGSAWCSWPVSRGPHMSI